MSEIELFRALVEERIGLSCAVLPRDRLSQVLDDRLRALGCVNVERYKARLAVPHIAEGEAVALAEQLTVGETYFFREPRQLDAFFDAALPALQRAREGLPVRVLSAGCATGEEPYSLAIAAAGRAALPGAQPVKILGIDINPAAIRKARRARYAPWAFRATPACVRERCFIDHGGEAELRPELRQAVSFEERNLFAPDPAFWAPGGFDAIFCRNVLIYMSRPTISAVIERLASALAPGGYLFLGHSESLRGVSDAFETLHTHDTFYYRLRAPAPRCPPPPPSRPALAAPTPVVPALAVPAPAVPALVVPALAVSEAATRADAGLYEGRLYDVRPRAPARGERPALTEVLSLIKQERFADALSILEEPSRGDASTEVRILVAVIFSHLGRTDEAARLCAEVLQQNGEDEGAHYLLGLCHEHEGAHRAAAQHYRSAIQIDRSFAMPRFRLGRLARRAGDVTTAWTETRRAAELFAREREGRVLLFGGGFQREALVELCQAELRAYGGRR